MAVIWGGSDLLPCSACGAQVWRWCKTVRHWSAGRSVFNAPTRVTRTLVCNECNREATVAELQYPAAGGQD